MTYGTVACSRTARMSDGPPRGMRQSITSRRRMNSIAASWLVSSTTMAASSAKPALALAARPTSCVLAAMISSARSCSRSAAGVRAASLGAVGASARTRAASRAPCPSSVAVAGVMFREVSGLAPAPSEAGTAASTVESPIGHDNWGSAMEATAGAIRVAVCARNRRAAHQLARAATGFDSKVVAQASDLGELYSALLGGSVEVVVLGDGISAEDAGPRIKGAWPGTKVVSMGDQAGGAAVDAWAAEPGEVETAILTTFLY